jgi:hypothetical protein
MTSPEETNHVPKTPNRGPNFLSRRRDVINSF